jgi:hypothetical protein
VVVCVRGNFCNTPPKAGRNARYAHAYGERNAKIFKALGTGLSPKKGRKK